MPPDPEPVEAVGEIAALLRSRPLVAFCERHGSAPQHHFLRALVADHRFAGAADAVVVEFGNARFQRLVDRYVSGRAVPDQEVAQVWQKTTQGPVWHAPVYSRFFECVRAANASLPAARRLRVLLGDPPVDWDEIHCAADLEPWYGERNRHFATVVEEQVLDRGLRALLVAGAFHFFRGLDRNETAILERRRPGCVWVLAVQDEAGAYGPAERFAEWPSPAVARLAGTSLAERPAVAASSIALGPAADAFLYFGLERDEPAA